MKKAYCSLAGYQPVQPHLSWLWKSSCQQKHKFFFWLLLLDRLNTRNLLKRKCFSLASYDCVFQGCNSEETSLHLFWECPFARACWAEISQVNSADQNIFEVLASIKKDLNFPFAMEILILGTWGIWICRNNEIFNN